MSHESCREAHSDLEHRLRLAEETADATEAERKEFDGYLDAVALMFGPSPGVRCNFSEIPARVAGLQQRVVQLEAALRFQDPRNATERYDRIADDFVRATGLWPPGRSRPLEMGLQSVHDIDRAHQEWRTFVNKWHERWFDRVLSTESTHPENVSMKEEKIDTCPCGEANNPLHVFVDCRGRSGKEKP